MADDLDRAHIDAALTLLRADTQLVLYPDAEGFTPVDAQPPYARAYFWIERPADAPGNSLAGISQSWTTYLNVHCVGENEYSAAGTQMRVARALLDKRPIVPTRVCGLIREYQCLPPARDTQSGRDLFDAISVYRFTSN